MREEERSIGYLISDVARLMRTVFDRRVHKLGLTRAQWLALTRLHRQPGASQSELAEMMEIEKASVGRIVDRLERNGWVTRQADPSDRRINRLYLTAEAEKVHKRMWRVAETTIDDALADLDEAEAEQLQFLMGRVKSRLTTLAAGDASDPATPQGRRGSKPARTFNPAVDADEAVAS